MSAWPVLELIPNLITFPADWRARTGEEFTAFKTLCLQASSFQPEYYPCQRNCGCWHRILRRFDGTGAVGACHCDPPNCPDFDLTPEDITPLEANPAKLGRAICRALTLDSKPADLGLLFTSQIGAWSANAVPAILTIQTHHTDYELVVANLVAQLKKPFILFAPTAKHFNARCQSLLSGVRADFFPLETTVTLKPGGTLVAARPPELLFAQFSPSSSSSFSSPSSTHSPLSTVKYALRKGLGVWHLIFDGHEADIRHEKGMFYVVWLLHHPDETPIHAIDLMAKVPEIYRQQLGLPSITDPATGKQVILESHARLQERSLALDDRQAMRALFRKQQQLEALLDTPDSTEPEKKEALTELEQIYEFQRKHARRSKDSAHRAVRTVRMAITRLHQALASALAETGATHPALRPFADHIQKHIISPSSRYRSRRSHSPGATSPGSFTYEPPPGLSWTNP
jgi:hypothetical protein